jgi:hypothetical protein
MSEFTEIFGGMILMFLFIGACLVSQSAITDGGARERRMMMNAKYGGC